MAKEQKTTGASAPVSSHLIECIVRPGCRYGNRPGTGKTEGESVLVTRDEYERVKHTLMLPQEQEELARIVEDAKQKKVDPEFARMKQAKIAAAKAARDAQIHQLRMQKENLDRQMKSLEQTKLEGALKDEV